MTAVLSPICGTHFGDTKDVASMARTSTKVFILEVMGRHAGWITAACGLASEAVGEAPHILLFPEVRFDEAAFLQGIDQSQSTGSVLHHLFAVRTLGLFERLPAAALPSYLSGLLIGEELRTQALPAQAAASGPLILIGSETLTLRYTLALQHLGISSQSRGAEATWAGLFALATAWQKASL